MTLLIDSHVLLSAAIGDPRLRGKARDAFVDPENLLLVSVATLWELGSKHALGKLRCRCLCETSSRDSGHRDPFDRMLVAQALAEGVRLLTGEGPHPFRLGSEPGHRSAPSNV